MMAKMQKKYGHSFVLLELPTSKEQLEQVTIQRSVALRSKHGVDFTLSLFGRSFAVDAICITIPAEGDQAERSRLVLKVTNHALSILRLTYKSGANVYGPMSFYRETESEIPELGVIINESLNTEYQINYDNIENVFRATISPDRAIIMALLAESQHPQFPVHYQILSLMRALELRLSERRDRDKWLDRYENEFRALNISGRAFRNALPEIRNWCAHGEGSGRGRAALAGSVYADIPSVAGFLVLLRRVVIEHIGNEYSGLQLSVNSPNRP